MLFDAETQLQLNLHLCIWLIESDILLNVLESCQAMLRKLSILRLYMHSDSYYREPCWKMCFFRLLGFSLSFGLSFPMAGTSVVIIPLGSGTVPMLWI